MHRQVASLFVVGFMVMIVAAGCRSGAPIYNVVDAPIVTSVGQERSLADVRKAIIEAGKQLNWAMVETQPGVITATQNVRRHQVPPLLVGPSSAETSRCSGGLSLMPLACRDPLARLPDRWS